MKFKAAFSIFILRILALKASLITVSLVASSHFLYFDYRYDFEDFVTFRYVMGVGAMSLVYGVVQLLFAGFYAFKHKRLITPPFEFYSDKGGFTWDAGDGYGNDKDVGEQFSQLWDKLLAASVFLFLAWLCLAVVSIISYHINNNNNNNTNSTLSSTHHHHHHNQNQNQSNTIEPSLTEPEQHTHVPTEYVKASSDDVSV